MKYEVNKTFLALLCFVPGMLAGAAEDIEGTFIVPKPLELCTTSGARFKSNFPKEKKCHRTIYYVDTEFLRQRGKTPEEKLNLNFLTFFETSGLHFLNGVAHYEDGSRSFLTIPVYLRTKEPNKDLAKLTALMKQIMPEYLRCRDNELKYGAMVNVLKVKKTIQVVPELNGQPRKVETFQNYLALLKRSNAAMEKFMKENRPAYRKADAQWKGSKAEFFKSLYNNGYSGRYFLESYTRGVPDLRFLAQHGCNFFFPHPHATFQAGMLGLHTEKNHFPLVLTLSRMPMGKGYDKEKFPDQRRSNGDYTRQDYRILAQRYPENIMGKIEEWGWNQSWACHNAPRIPKDRLDAEQVMIDSMRQYLKFWLPGIPVFSWDNFGVPGIQYEGGVDIFLFEGSRGENFDMAMASLRGDSKAYKKPFALSVTEKSWLPAHLDWGLINNGRKNSIGGIFHTTKYIWDSGKPHNKPSYAPEEVWRFYKYAYFSGATVIGHEAAYLKPLAERFISYLKRHPATDMPLNRIAVMRGQADSTTLAVRGDDARNTGVESIHGRDFFNGADVKECRGLTDWGYTSHLRDYNLLNIFFPEFGNEIYSRRQFTGTPFGAIDLLYGRAPLMKKNHDFTMVISVNIMESKQIAKLKKYLAGGGKLVMNIEQCKGRRRSYDQETLAFLKEVCGVIPGKTLPESDDVVICGKKKYPVFNFLLNDVKLAGAVVVAVNGKNKPVCVKKRYGKGEMYLTLSQWHWRMPLAFMNDLTKQLCKDQNLIASFAHSNRYIAHYVNCLKNKKAAVLALFNNQYDHTAQQHYRRLFKNERLAIPNAKERHCHVVLKDNTPQTMMIDFGKNIDFKAYDELIMNLRADGRKPGGSFSMAFYDANGKKATWTKGLETVSRLVGSKEQWFFKSISPQYLSKRFMQDNKTASFNSDFDWEKVRRMEVVLEKGEGNPPLEYDFYLKDSHLQNLFWRDRKGYKRPSVPFSDTVTMDVKALGLNPENTVVYECGEWWNPKPIRHKVVNGKIVFKANVPGDFGEYLFCNKDDKAFAKELIDSGKLPPESKNWRDAWL